MRNNIVIVSLIAASIFFSCGNNDSQNQKVVKGEPEIDTIKTKIIYIPDSLIWEGNYKDQPKRTPFLDKCFNISSEGEVKVDFLEPYLDQSVLNEKLSSSAGTFIFENQVLVEITSKGDNYGELILLSFDINGSLKDQMKVEIYREKSEHKENYVRAMTIVSDSSKLSFDILETINNTGMMPSFIDCTKEGYYINTDGKFTKR